MGRRRAMQSTSCHNTVIPAQLMGDKAVVIVHKID